MKLKLLTPQNIVVEKEVVSLTLPGALGQLTVLTGHDFLLSSLNAGKLYFRFKDGAGNICTENYEIGRGTVQVTHSEAKVFVDSAKPLTS